MQGRLQTTLSSRWLRRFAILVATLLLLALISWLAVPKTITYLVSAQIDKQLGRQASIEDVRFNPFTLKAETGPFTIYDADKKTVMIRVNQILVDLSWRSLFHLAPVVEALRLDAPEVHITRFPDHQGQHTNLGDMLANLKPAESSGQAAFSLSNIEISNGLVVLDDQFTRRKIVADKIDVGVPFISTFDTALETWVTPHFQTRLDGKLITASARSRPFSANQDTTLDLRLDALDIPAYLPLIPATLPVVVRQGKLSSKLNVHFIRHDDHAIVTVSGDATMTSPVIEDRHGQPLIKANSLAVTLASAQWPANRIELNAIHLNQPEVWVTLNAEHQLNWALGDTDKPDKPAKEAATSEPVTSENTDTGPTKKEPAGMPVLITRAAIHDGKLHWQDSSAAAQPGVSMTLDHINVESGHVNLSVGAAPATVVVQAGDAKQGLHFAGQIAPLSGEASGRLSADIALSPVDSALSPYIQNATGNQISGNLAASTLVIFRQGNLQLHQLDASVDTLKAGTVSARGIALKNARVDLNGAQFAADDLLLDGASASLERDIKQGVYLPGWNLATANQKPAVTAKVTATKVATATTHDSPSPAASSLKSPAPAWHAVLGRLTINDSALSLKDKSNNTGNSSNFSFSAINGSLNQLDSALSKPATLALQAKLNKSGTISIKGNATPHLDQIQLKTALSNIGLTEFAPYLNSVADVAFDKGHINMDGNITVDHPLDAKKMALAYKGSLRINALSGIQAQTKEQFIAAQSINLSGIDVSYASGKSKVDVDLIAFDHFFARLLLDAKGKLNFTTLAHEQGTQAADTAVAGNAANDNSKTSTDTPVTSTLPDTTRTTVGQNTVRTLPESPDVAVSVKKMTLQDSMINYTDNFIQPNYTANLTDLTGKIGTVSNSPSQKEPAQIEINGRVENEAPLLINGAFNPFAKNLFLDIKGSTSGLNLPKLSTYSVKYIGYEIQKGKLSMDVSYRIDNNKLVAQNKIRLEQLNLGNKVPSPTATTLPVSLAIALLKDRSGEINIDLPITGSLDDPQFSIAQIIRTALFNLLRKIITSPFSLIASAFGGDSATLDYAEFDPGQAALSPAVSAKLDTIGKALNDRPAIKIDLSGRADPVTDIQGLRQNELTYKMIALKIAERKRQGIEPDDNPVEFSPAERSQYLLQLYEEDKTIVKPQNVLGFNKSISDDDMTALLLPQITISQDMLNGIAIHRAEIVRNYLTDQLHISPDRIFIVAPHTGASDVKDKGKISRVDFSLK